MEEAMWWKSNSDVLINEVKIEIIDFYKKFWNSVT